MTHVETHTPEPLEIAALERRVVKNAPYTRREGRSRSAVRARWVALLAGLLALGCERRARDEARVEVPAPSASPTRQSSVPPLDVGRAYPNVESVGATRRVRWEKTQAVDAHSPPDAWKITLDASGDYAGVCWKNKPGNEGEAPGDDLSRAGYRRIVVWARGAAGGESVEFRAGGLGNVKTRYSDSFDVSAGRVRLTPVWKEYGIYVTNADLSSVMTPFCVLVHREGPARETVIYVDGIEYRG